MTEQNRTGHEQKKRANAISVHDNVVFYCTLPCFQNIFTAANILAVMSHTRESETSRFDHQTVNDE